MSNRSSRPKNRAHCRGSARRYGPGITKTLYDMQPGGSLYADWVHVPAGMNSEEWVRGVANDDRVSEDAATMMSKVPYFEAIYGNPIPITAATLLDHCLDLGWIGLQRDQGPGMPTTDEAQQIPLDEFVPAEGMEEGETIRDCLHRLHAAGLLLMECEGVVALGTPWYLKNRAQRVAAGELG